MLRKPPSAVRPVRDSLPWYVSLLLAWLPFLFQLVVIIIFFRILLGIRHALDRLVEKEKTGGS
jgi:hypothetical protein